MISLERKEIYIQTIASSWHENMLGYLFADRLFRKANSFPRA